MSFLSYTSVWGIKWSLWTYATLTTKLSTSFSFILEGPWGAYVFSRTMLQNHVEIKHCTGKYNDFLTKLIPNPTSTETINVLSCLPEIVVQIGCDAFPYVQKCSWASSLWSTIKSRTRVLQENIPKQNISATGFDHQDWAASQIFDFVRHLWNHDKLNHV